MPRLPESEILLAYNQIAETRQLIKTAADENAEIAKYKDELHPRIDGRSLEEISKLYNLQPEGQFKDKKIVEVAHPNSVIMGPAYDPINALVENEEERANISRNIATKPTDGLLTNYKYAKQNLSLSLVRLANYLDATNQEQLRALADQCLDNLHSSGKKKLLKTANPLLAVGLEALFLIVPLVIGARSGKPDKYGRSVPSSTFGRVVRGLSIVASLAGLANHLNEQLDQGLVPELERAAHKTQEILNLSEIKANSSLTKVFTELFTTLTTLHQEAIKFSELEITKQDFTNPEILKEMKDNPNLSQKMADEIIFIKQFIQDLNKLNQKLMFYKSQLTQAATLHSAEGTLSQVWQMAKEFFSSNDFDQLKTYLDNIYTSMEPVLASLKQLGEIINNLPTELNKVKSAYQEINQELKVKEPSKIETKPSSETIPEEESEIPTLGSDDWIFE